MNNTFFCYLLGGKIPLEEEKGREGGKLTPPPGPLPAPLFCFDLSYLNIFPEDLNKRGDCGGFEPSALLLCLLAASLEVPFPFLNTI